MYFTLQSSQISHFFPILAHACYWCHLCSMPAPVLHNTAHSRSLSPQSPLSIRCPHIYTAMTLPGPSTQQPDEITCGFHSVLWKSSPWSPFYDRGVIYIAIRCRTWIQPEKSYFSGPPATMSLWRSSLEPVIPEGTNFSLHTHIPCKFWGED